MRTFASDELTEIRDSYRNAADQKKQIGILADLHDCTVQDIQQVLGLPVSKRKVKPAPTDKPDESASLLDGVSYAKIFGMALRKVRRLNSETQAEAAAALGVSKSALAKYERGEREPGFRVLQRIVRHYDVPIDKLLPFARSATSAEENQNEIVCSFISEAKTMCAELDRKIARAKELAKALRVLAEKGGSAP